MRISVCMAVFNGEKYIKDQLDSILLQIGPEDEVIISDDGSNDQTLPIIKSISDNRIKIVYSGQKSIIKNFENSLKTATGDVIFLSDQDDIWYPNKISIMVSFLNDYLMVFSNASVFKESMLDTYLLYDQNVQRTGFLKNFIKNNFIGATMAFQRKVLERALPFPKKIYMHDVWIGLVSEIEGKTHFIEEPLVYYRRHGNNASETGEKSSNSLFTKIKMRYDLGLSLLRRFL
ncbi:glycosyltransferase family 2 protein [Maribacter sp. MAR_2009_72]|uniref:glycosyltransferase family 2 protein n=1 Tax=Maribacter sp. MAR_2009_72 TaxID=1250050 RepID=UPI001199A250|nr:glycosyltransferase family 2 protein [Maribacter sp. MAR_2009_72]TVZ16179.1 glycosyltransferase involved in cell wall biosynthesis [Maribacter sp. MAR_2009_72]